MSKELMWLTLTVILTGVLWIPYILDRIMVRGLMGAMANPSRNDKPQSPWAQRLYFAHTNAVENLVIFAALVLILEAQDHSTESTVIACAVYFWARLARAYDENDETSTVFRRVLTPAAKFWICKRAPFTAFEAMEVLGGSGYIEESIMPRLYREAPVNSIWEGSGNVMCLDVLRAI